MRFKIEDYEMDRFDWELLIDRWIIGKNAERNREIAKRQLLDGIGFERLAGEYDLSVTQTKNIVYKCLNTLLKHL